MTYSPFFSPELDMDPGTGDPGSIHTLASTSAGLAGMLGERAEDSQRATLMLEEQSGKATAALTDRATAIGRLLGGLGDEFRRVTTILDNYADEVAYIARQAEVLRSDAITAKTQAIRAGGHELWDQTWHDTPPAFAASRAAWHAAVERYDASVAGLRVLTSQRAALDAHTADQLSSHRIASILGGKGNADITNPDAARALVALTSGDRGLVTAAGLAGLQDPATVRRVWDSLSESDRERLIAGGAPIIGNLDGVPLGARARANRINIQAEIDRLQRENDATNAEIKDWSDAGAWSWPGNPIPGLMAKVDANQQAIDYYRSLLDGTTQYWSGLSHRFRAGSCVIAFDPSAQSIAIYHGDLDGNGDIPANVKDIGLYVPGTGTKMESFGGTDIRTTNLYNGMSGADGQHAAMIVWSGGPQPQGAGAALTKYADDMGPKLATFVNDLRTPAGSTLTVMGHSYGGTTVSTAEKDGLRADRILYVSSAGLGNGTKSISEFPYTADVPHYALMARHDGIVGPIQGVQVEGHGLGHGASPLDAPGIVHLETGYEDAVHKTGRVDDVGALKSHSGVFKVGSTSFQNIVGVLTGGRVLPYAPDQYRMVDGAVVTFDGDEFAGWDDPSRWIQVK